MPVGNVGRVKSIVEIVLRLFIVIGGFFVIALVVWVFLTGR